MNYTFLPIEIDIECTILIAKVNVEFMDWHIKVPAISNKMISNAKIDLYPFDKIF